MKRPLQILAFATLLSGLSLTAAAQERLCDPEYEDCRTPLINYIRTETRGIDVAFWFMQDARYATELINRHRAGVPLRVIVDQQANNTKPGNAQIIADLAAAGIPMRHRAVGDILHFKMMLFDGQDVVQFSKANYTPSSFVPEQPNANYFDEVIFFTDDLTLTNSFRRRFDDLWIDTSRYQNFANIATAPVRRYPGTTIDPSMNFPTLENFADRSVSRFNAETQRIDAIVYRITDSLMPNALLSAVARQVSVRLITEPEQYRDLTKRWHSAHVDRMYMGGVQIKHRQHAGLMHQGSVVLHNLGEVIFGSSNWTTYSAIWQDEHNYFYRPVPGNEKLWFFQWFADQFQEKWNDTANYVAFQPQPPDPLTTYIAPVNGASGLSASVTLTWDGGPWAHLYDIQLGTTPTALAQIGPPNQQLGSPDDGRRETITVSNLQPGTTYYWRIVSKTWALQSRTGPVWSFTTAGTPPGGGGTPYGGTPAAVPGVFQAENFDEGAQFVAYYDTTANNSGGAYRSTGVDIATTTDTGGGHYVGWTKAGEWLKYTVNVGTDGTYPLQTRLAALGTGGRFHVEIDGVDRTGPITVPNTGAWDAWQTITTTGIPLSAGLRTVRVVFDTIGTGGAVAGFNWFQFGAGSSPPPPPYGGTPYGGTAAAIPGVVQAENFDEGGANVAYFDASTTNSGGAYRSTGVDIATTTDTGGGHYVGWTKAGEWVKYSVSVATAGTYTLQTRLAALGTGGRFHVEVDGVDRTGPITVPNTGAWDAWQTLPTANVSLTAGPHVIRVVFDVVGTGGAVAGFNWFQFVAP
jgi:hypothetical protein